MSESDITAAILDYLAFRGAWAFKVHGGTYQRPGIPDIGAILGGRAIWIEVKVPQPLMTVRQIERFLNPNQRRELEAIARAGGMAVVATSLEDVMQLLEGIKP